MSGLFIPRQFVDTLRTEESHARGAVVLDREMSLPSDRAEVRLQAALLARQPMRTLSTNVISHMRNLSRNGAGFKWPRQTRAALQGFVISPSVARPEGYFGSCPG